jgi:DNA-binding MarR family transcriptional regulator
VRRVAAFRDVSAKGGGSEAIYLAQLMSYAKDMPTHAAHLARTDAGLASALRVSIMRLSRRLRNERDAADDLTPNQLAVLGTLWRHGAMTIGDLAEAEKVQPPSMTRTVNAMHVQGLVARHPRDSDRRVVVIELTDVAHAVLQESRRRKEAWLNRQLSDLTPAERTVLREAAPILERLSQA